MPDLLTHVAAAYGVSKADRSRRLLSSWVLIGAILPDILTRPLTIIDGSTYWVTMPLHTPLGLTLVCAAISLVFVGAWRVFWNLMLGCAVHVFLDILQKHIAGSYFLLFPFTWSSFEFDVVWPETSLYLAPVWLLLGAWVLKRRMRRRVATSGGESPESAG